MLRRSLGAGSFAGFWRFWNPVFGYYLGRYSYAPLQRVMPRGPALILTFSLCGAIHDAVTTALRGSVTLLFTSWFIFLAIGVLIGNACGMDLSQRTWIVRAGVNLAYLATCLLISVLFRQVLEIP